MSSASSTATATPQIRLAKAPWTVAKPRGGREILDSSSLVSVATGGAWIFYFADAPTLARELLRGEAPGVAYATVAILTATTFVFGGFMREQVCIYMCPWPRIQTAMIDEKSLIVTYKDWRGEPRGGEHQEGATLPTWSSATASTATSASPSARPASTSATGRRSAASPARCASTPATR